MIGNKSATTEDTDTNGGHWSCTEGFRVLVLFVCASVLSVVLLFVRAHAAADPIFIESAAATGLAFTHVNGATGRYYLHAANRRVKTNLADLWNNIDEEVTDVADRMLAQRRG